MAHPKSKISKQRRNKRRTHKKLTAPALSTCPTTGEFHQRHRAYWYEGKMYYKGQVVIDASEAEAETEGED